MSTSLTEHARVAMNAVVQIYAEGHNDADPRSILDPRMISKQRWSGSGFFIKLNGVSGHILTNSHVIRNATSLKIMTVMTSEEMFKVQVVGQVKSLEPDIALLRLSDHEFKRLQEIAGEIPHLEFATDEEICRGVEIKAIGYPLGMVEPNISGGEITNFISGNDDECERLVTDAAINPGNSGGPSIMEGGKVVGINTSIIMNANNIGFITPIFYARILLENLSLDGPGVLAQLGAHFQKNSPANAKYLKMNSPKGIIVKSLTKNGFLSLAGLIERDVITSVNGVEFDRHGIVSSDAPKYLKHKNIYDVMRLCPLGSSIPLTFVRQGKEMSAQGKAMANPQEAIHYNFDVFDRPYIYFEGMIIQQLSYQIIDSLAELEAIDYRELVKVVTRNAPTLVLTHVDADGQTDELALDIGDCIGRANGVEMKTLKDFLSMIKEAQKKGENIFLEMSSGAIGNFDPKNGAEFVQLEEKGKHERL